jgi:hypothetical protein
MAEIVSRQENAVPMHNWKVVSVICEHSIFVGDYLVYETERTARKVTRNDPMRHLVALGSGRTGESINASVEIVEM